MLNYSSRTLLEGGNFSIEGELGNFNVKEQHHSQQLHIRPTDYPIDRSSDQLIIRPTDYPTN